MSVLTEELVSSTLTLLSEPVGSTVGEVETADGGIAFDTPTVIITFLRRAAEDLARTCVYLPGRGEKAAFAADGIAFQDLTMLGGAGQLWAALSVQFAGVPLDHIAMERLQLHRPGWQFAPASVPRNFIQEGGALMIYPAPATADLLQVAGACLPPPIVAGGSVSFLSDDLLRLLLPYRAAKMICEKKFDDDSLFPRAELLAVPYNEARLRLWQALSPWLRQRLYSTPPVVLPTAAKGK